MTADLIMLGVGLISIRVLMQVFVLIIGGYP